MKKLSILSFCLSSVLSAQTINFTPQAHVFDDGQKVTALELETAKLKFNRQALTAKTFRVLVKGSLPITAGENKVSGLVEGERKIKTAKVNRKGNIELHFAEDKLGNTLAYVGGSINRNVLQKLDYEITPQAVNFLPKVTHFAQQDIADDEVAKFTAQEAQSGLKYQLFKPQNITEKRPLIIWLHGNGEGGVGDYQNNLSPLLANRGGVAFTTPETQRIFGGAYVVVPQVPDTWYYNYQKGYLGKLKSLIEQVMAENAIDKQRIYLFGASAGGYMAIRMLLEYPELFAAVNVSAPALDKAAIAGGVATTAEELQRIQGKPLWLVHATNDAIISYTATSKRVFQQLRDHGAILSLYPEVKTPDGSYNGHFSWIYSLRNQPTNPQGEQLFKWMARQRLN